MQCAKCQGRLKPIEVDHIELDRCEECRGLWFDPNELNEVLQHGRYKLVEPVFGGNTRLVSAPSNHTPGACPRCKTDLTAIESLVIDGLIYDDCPKCGGIWLDAGELAVLGSHPDAQAMMDFFTKAQSV